MATPAPPAAGNTAYQTRSAPFFEISCYVSRGKCVGTGRSLMETELMQARDEVKKRIHELYEQGVPFFSKKVFQHALEQIEHCRNAPTPPNGAKAPIISMPTVDGRVVEYVLETGSVKPYHPDEWKDTEFVVGDPYLDYRAVQHLTRSDDIDLFDPDAAYSPTQLLYPLLVRDKATGEFLVPSDCASVANLREAFAAGVKSWEDSEDCKDLRSLLETRDRRLPKVSKIVAFACSTMAVVTDDEARRSRIIHQHALMLTLRDIFSRQQQQPGEGAPEIKCFAQDPSYTETDAAVLQETGITVLGDPRGFLEVDDESIVISFSPNIPVRQVIADIARPAVLAWNHVKSEPEEAAFCNCMWPGHGPEHFCDPGSSRLRDMVRDYYHEPVRLGPEKAFGEASVYIRRE
ncbi:hypothetical protein N657DRAFT_647404 [Parathielavia appendiculata]|uniref:SRR1-like domain-containing protein n=1 Tax=Parathielavia appendiculata TaxID=2587402 RepID=A0AAN6TW88_9PEZI|nr:hypothetical protein N657DRAFT_647404 [Parathielavia appendiculata]